MSVWSNIPALLSLRAEFNELAPHRDTGADGTIGDKAHQAKSSDHNPDDTRGAATPHSDADSLPEVHALDIDSTGPWPAGMTMPRAVAVIVAKMKAMGTRAPLAYVIWDHKIWSGPAWIPAAYHGTDPHTGHAHFSCRYGSGPGPTNPENYTGPWGLLEAFAVLNADDKSYIRNEIHNAAEDVLEGILAVKIGDAAYPNRTIGDVLRDAAKLRGVLVGDAKDTANAKLPAGSPLGALVAKPAPKP